MFLSIKSAYKKGCETKDFAVKGNKPYYKILKKKIIIFKLF